MQSKKLISTFIVLFMLVLGLRAQNGNVVISEVKAFDLGNGTARLEVKVSGNLATSYMTASFSAQPADGSGIGVIGTLVNPNEVPQLGGPRDIVLVGSFPYTPSMSNGPDFYQFSISYGIPRRNVIKLSPIGSW